MKKLAQGLTPKQDLKRYEPGPLRSTALYASVFFIIIKLLLFVSIFWFTLKIMVIMTDYWDCFIYNLSGVYFVNWSIAWLRLFSLWVLFVVLSCFYPA